MNAYVNIDLLRSEVFSQLENSPSLIDAAFEVAEARMSEAKAEFLEKFENSPITKELEEGPESNGGLLPKGNLYGFIGFTKGENPIQVLREAFTDWGYVKKTSRGARYGQDSILYRFPAYLPSRSIIENASPSPKWLGGSWVKGVEERGIEGLEFFLAKDSPNSRSSAGIQGTKQVRGTQFTPMDYVFKFAEEFKKSIA